MKNYLFHDYETGEDFIVETDTKEKAYLCAYTYFKDPKFCGEISYFEAEMLGLDTYQKGENKMLTNEYIYQRAYEIFDMIMDKADNHPQTYDEIILTLTTVNSLIENKIMELLYERME